MVTPKMCNISKTIDRRVKQGTTVNMWRLRLMRDSLNLIWGHMVQCAIFPILQFLKLCSSPNFHMISSKLYTRYPNHGAIQVVTFLAICQKLRKS